MRAELKLKVLALGLVLGLATAVTNTALAMHDYVGLAEYSALTSAVWVTSAIMHFHILG